MTSPDGGSVALSERLSAIAAMTEEAVRELRGEEDTAGIGVADIGTDHGYLPIWLASRGVAERVIAVDVRKGPLARAQEHVRAAGLEGRIDVRLSDGFAALSPGEAQIAVLSGMGGRLMKRLLTAASPAALGILQLILQPQSEAKELWLFLKGNGWAVVDERMIYEEDRFYTMMRAVRAGSSVKKEAGDFGAFLSARRDETWRLLLEKERDKTGRLMKELAENGAPKERIEELAAQRENIEAALAVFREGEER